MAGRVAKVELWVSSENKTACSQNLQASCYPCGVRQVIFLSPVLSSDPFIHSSSFYRWKKNKKQNLDNEVAYPETWR